MIKSLWDSRATCALDETLMDAYSVLRTETKGFLNGINQRSSTATQGNSGAIEGRGAVGFTVTEIKGTSDDP